MPKPRPLTASECARLTGITVKALRVYERSGLIKPARSANGYRIYGQKELVRLNAIATLKSVGLTLAQIRDAFETSSPRLSRILQMQLDEWRARRAAAEKAMVVVESALMRVSARETLSIEELCQLIRSIEMSNVLQVTRTLINEALTPEEERAWSTYYATLSPEETALHREHFETSRTITQELLRLMNAGAEPASGEVLALVERSNDLNTRCRFREGYLERLEWNEPLTRKLLALGQRLVATTAEARSAGTTEPAKTSDDFADFMTAAHRASKAGQALAGPLGEAKALLARGEKPGSAAAQAVARRFVEICSLHNLGTPLAYARWIVEFAPMMRGRETAKLYQESGEPWRFMADATAALAS
jgi:DNA-binding transcriptional MerR regulator